MRHRKIITILLAAMITIQAPAAAYALPDDRLLLMASPEATKNKPMEEHLAREEEKKREQEAKIAEEMEALRLASLTDDGLGPILMIGDSRTVGLAQAVGAKGSLDASGGIGHYETDSFLGGTRFAAKESEGSRYLTKAWEKASSWLGNGGSAVIWLGVNDLWAADTYISLLNGIAGQADVFVVEVTPVADRARDATNAEIQTFNERLRQNLSEDITIIPLYDFVKSLGDGIYDQSGVHYSDEVSKLIWGKIQETLKVYEARGEEDNSAETEETGTAVSGENTEEGLTEENPPDGSAAGNDNAGEAVHIPAYEKMPFTAPEEESS